MTKLNACSERITLSVREARFLSQIPNGPPSIDVELECEWALPDYFSSEIQ